MRPATAAPCGQVEQECIPSSGSRCDCLVLPAGSPHRKAVNATKQKGHGTLAAEAVPVAYMQPEQWQLSLLCLWRSVKGAEHSAAQNSACGLTLDFALPAVHCQRCMRKWLCFFLLGIGKGSMLYSSIGYEACCGG